MECLHREYAIRFISTMSKNVHNMNFICLKTKGVHLKTVYVGFMGPSLVYGDLKMEWIFNM